MSDVRSVLSVKKCPVEIESETSRVSDGTKSSFKDMIKDY